MNTFLVRDVNICLPAAPAPFTTDLHFQTNCGVMDAEFQTQDTQANRQLRWRRYKSPLPSIMETFTLRVSRQHQPHQALLEATAFGPALAKFMGRYHKAALKMIFYGQFMHGFTLWIELFPRFEPLPQTGAPPVRWFYGNTPIDSTTQLGNVSVSLEILEQKAYDFGSYHNNTAFLQELYSNKNFDDFILISNDGQQFQCSKKIISGRSQVLDAMLTHNFIENTTNNARVDASGAGVDAFLKFIYFGELKQPYINYNTAMDLLNLGHFFMMDGLVKAMIDLFMMKTQGWLDIDSLIHLYNSTINKYGLEGLKAKTVAILKARRGEVENSGFARTLLYGSEQQRAQVTMLFNDLMA